MPKTKDYLKKKSSGKDDKQQKPMAISNCHVRMPVKIGKGVRDLSLAVQLQAKANMQTSLAIQEIASKMTPRNMVGFHLGDISILEGSAPKYKTTFKPE